MIVHKRKWVRKKNKLRSEFYYCIYANKKDINFESFLSLCMFLTCEALTNFLRTIFVSVMFLLKEFSLNISLNSRHLLAEIALQSLSL